MKEKNAIVVACGENCTKQIHVLLTSIFYNNQEMLFDIYFLYIDISEEDIAFYKRIVMESGNTCHFIRVSDICVKKTQYAHVTNETFLRLLIPELLPNDIKRALYLDYDIVVNGSLKLLFEHPFGEASLLAAEVDRDQKRWSKLKRDNKMPERATYFNAGVLVMNLDRLRCDEHFKRPFVLQFLKEHLNEIKEDDQGYLNHFLWNKVKILNGYKYNYNAGMYYCEGGNIMRRLIYMCQCLRRERVAMGKATIIHYRGPSKPWAEDYSGQCARVYGFYLGQAGYMLSNDFHKKQAISKRKNVLHLIREK